MCGITGVLTFDQATLDTSRLKSMVDVIAHRGPDDAGYLVWRAGRRPSSVSYRGQAFADSEFCSISPNLPVIDAPSGKEKLARRKWNLFLGHRRLSIIDLSPRGHQPMSDQSGNVWVTYNGEIYNFRELRKELVSLGHSFASLSDTEVLIHAYLEWGIECIHRLNGMFAFALWDNHKQRLYLVRDRYGIKPLYYYHDAKKIVFGSEIKSILRYLPQRPTVDLPALNEYFSFQNIFSDRTLFHGITLLPSGCYLTVSMPSGHIERHQYWDFDFSVESDAGEPELQEQLYGLIQRAVERQCVSDVPIGSYLSGGMDSGSVTAIASRHLGRISTFTAGFDLSEAAEHEMKFDERELAEKMASIFQTEHYECVLHAGDIEAVMDKLIWHLEDLRIGQSYPNFYVARLAGRFVKVVLSGAGGDELFGGYPWRYAAAIGPDHANYVQNYYKYWKRLVANRDKPRFFNSDTVNTLKNMSAKGTAPFQDHTLSVFQNVFGDKVETKGVADQINHSLYFECKTFLHGVLLVEDKLSMAHSLETRVPLLDNELVDFACRVPIRYKVAGMDHLEKLDENLLRKKELYQDKIHSGKNILRAAMEQILPSDVTEARKQGFSAPDESWFRGRNEAYVRDTLLSSNAGLRTYINQDFICDALDQHSAGTSNYRLLIWSLLSFETWLKIFAR